MADQDQIIHDLEQRHISLRKEYDLVLADRDSLKGTLTHLFSSSILLRFAIFTEKYAASKQENEKLRDEKDAYDRKVTELTAETRQVILVNKHLSDKA